MNKILLTRHLGGDPALRESANHEKYCRFNLATDEFWRDSKGDRQKRTEWHSVFFWGPQAEALVKHVYKGSKLFVEGRLESRDDPDTVGAPRRLIWSVRGLHYELLDRRQEVSPEPPAPGPVGAPLGGDLVDDDVPL